MLIPDTYSVNVNDVLSIKLRQIMWYTFFYEKNRGITLSRHFPWIDFNRKDVKYFELCKGDDVLGGLTLKINEIAFPKENIAVGVVGLVCIEKNYRSKGLSMLLLEAVIQYSKKNNIDILTLWTSKHRVYEKVGFSVNDNKCYGFINKPYSLKQELISEIHKEDLSTITGVPPFASSVERFFFEGVTVTVIKDNTGLIVADWSGDERKIIKLIMEYFPISFRINASIDSSLITKLVEAGCSSDIKPVRLQMWMSLKKNIDVEKLLECSHFDVLNRI